MTISNSLMDQVEKNRKNIKYDTLMLSVAELVRMCEDKEIIVNPNFQRLFRWRRSQQSSFIESLILEIPIPPLFFYETEQGTWELLDGLQRISTMIRFMGTSPALKVIPDSASGKSGNDDEWHYNTNENDLNIPLQLLTCHKLADLAGHTFKSLPTPLQLNLKRARIHVNVLKRETHKDYKYEVFKRLNDSGSILEDQEIRNCSIRLISDTFPDFLRSRSANPAFSTCLGLADEQMRNGYIEELVLRFFAMKNFSGKFKHDVSEFLTAFMEEVAGGTVHFDYKVESERFDQIVGLINEAAPDGDAFKGRDKNGNATGPFSPALFEIVMLGISNHLEADVNISAEWIREKLRTVSKTAKELELVGGGSNSKKKTLGRIEFSKKHFA